MYSKPKSDEPLRIPENYSGNAFLNNEIKKDDLSLAFQKPAQEEYVPQPAEALPVAIDEKKTQTHTPAFSLLPPKISSSKGGLLGDIGVEELLIIGVLILLSQSETDDDILLLLMLLLFYK